MAKKDPLYIPQEDDELPIVYKVIGAPGTGKTTRVVGNPDLDMKGLFLDHLDDYSIDEQMIVTYTKAGTEEAADRIEKMLNAPKYKINERVTTIHSQCFGLLNLDRDQVVQHWDKKQFCDSQGLEYGWDDDEDDIMGADLDEGNALFRIYGWLSSNRKGIEDWEDCPIGWDHDSDPAYLMNEWDAYKSRNDLIDFSDMIENVIEKGYEQLDNLGWGVLFPDEETTTREMFEAAAKDPHHDPDVVRGKGAFVDTKVLYVDEVQDLTPLQWEWYLLQKLVCEKVFIGGDDDQTIYGWAGANPEFMLNEEGDFEVLDKTYRIPSEIWEKCDGVIEQVDVRQEKEVIPAEEGGTFETYRAPSSRQIKEHIEDGECMVLFRANYMIDEFREDLHEMGIPYRNMSTYDTWSDDLVKLRDALAKLDDDEATIKGDELDAMMEHAEDHMLDSRNNVSEKEKVLGQLGGITGDRVEDIFDVTSRYGRSELTAKNFLEATDEVNWYEKQAILGNLRNGNEDMYPDRVRIGTIHSSKGKEAETVVVGTDSTATILDEMRKDLAEQGKISNAPVNNGPTPITDAERRVYYVAMTRASQELVLAQGIVNPDNAIDIDSILKGDHSADEWESGSITHGTSW